MLVSRISRRVLAEHHIALSKDYKARQDGEGGRPDHVGVIYTGLSIRESIERCTQYLRSRAFDVDSDMPSHSNWSADWSEVIVDGHTDTKFPYIRQHLEYVLSMLNGEFFSADVVVCSYIIFELLKNVCTLHVIHMQRSHGSMQSFRATRMRHPTASKLPPIRATIISGEDHVAIRISDQGSLSTTS